MKPTVAHLASMAVLALLGVVTAAKLPSLRGGVRMEQNTLNPERKLGTHTYRKRDWLKISQAPPNVVHAPMGERLELECEVIGSPPPTIQWIKGSSTPQSEDFESNQILDNLGTSTGLAKIKSRLVIDCIMPEHEGLYTCVAMAGGKSTVAPPAMVLIQGHHVNNITALLAACPGSEDAQEDRPPRIIEWSPVAMVGIGNDVTLPCRASGNPAPTVYWLDGDNDLVSENDPRFKVLPNGDLLIFKLRWDDMGGYTCVASNRRGRDSTNAFIYPLLKDDS